MSGAIIQKIRKNLTDDEHRYRFQIILIPMIFSLISFGMSVLNYITGEYMLMSATLLFSILSFICSIVSYISKKTVKFSYTLFNILLVIMSVSFIIDGGADGFSPLWIILLPACGLIFSGRKSGTFFCALLFAIMVFLMWTPTGRGFIRYDYSETFLLRFPILYFSCYFVGLFFETTRKMTYDSLKATQQELWELSVKDGMTGVLNHARFTHDLDELVNDEANHTAGFIYVDINGLKHTNDTQSHDVGDRMIYSCVRVLTRRFPNDICYRMGGDEFIVFLRDCTEEYFLEQIGLIRDDYSKVTDVSVAVGGAYASGNADIREAVIRADSDMQAIKNEYYREAGLDRRK